MSEPGHDAKIAPRADAGKRRDGWGERNQGWRRSGGETCAQREHGTRGRRGLRLATSAELTGDENRGPELPMRQCVGTTRNCRGNEIP